MKAAYGLSVLLALIACVVNLAAASVAGRENERFLGYTFLSAVFLFLALANLYMMRVVE